MVLVARPWFTPKSLSIGGVGSFAAAPFILEEGQT